MDSRAPEFSRLLECVAISDALDGLLLLNATAAVVESVAERLAGQLAVAGAKHVDRVRLGSASTEDSLWGTPGLPTGWGGRGLLVPPPDTTRIVIVQDLSRLSQAAARAGVMMMGVDEVDLQRRGQSLRLPVRHRWVAALPDESAGSVSTHLLERFAIRVRIEEAAELDRVKAVRRQLAGTRRVVTDRDSADRVRKRTPHAVQVDEAAIDRAIALLPGVTVVSPMRSLLGLMQVALAWTRLDRSTVVEAKTIDRVAATLGLVTASPVLDDTGEARPAVVDDDSIATAADQLHAAERDRQKTIVEPVAASGVGAEGRALDAGDVIDSGKPVVDTLVTPVEPQPAGLPPPPREYATLRLPWRQSRTASSGHGEIIGTRRTDVLQDLAVLDTLLAAAPFQEWRRGELKRTGKEMIVRRQDLRAHRRAPPANELLVLVIDYTSVRKRAWLNTLLPYVAQAYEARAEVCIVKVGAKFAENPTRAERLLARSILVPSVAAALEEEAGSATPLADGLLQAYRTIQQALGHGRSSTRRATLVVVTDGRGNVPLQGSRQGKITTRVGREGIEDAKQVGREIRMLSNVKRVLVNTEPDWLKDLPFSLAAALGADVVRLSKSNA